jgi:cyclic beta-1,2-glucan synthetase
MSEQNPSETQSERVAEAEIAPETILRNQRARRLAESHSIARQSGRKPIPTTFLNDYEKFIREVVQYFRGVDEPELALSYAAEWILDNYYVVIQALRQINEDLPAKYYRELPVLTSGPLEGYPRIYALAREFIIEEKVHVNLDQVMVYVQEYEQISPLNVGELWALPIMLRLAIIQALVASLSRITGLDKGLPDVEVGKIELGDSELDDEVVANGILSLRILAAQDWKKFIEELSLVEAILRLDPAGVYPEMDFETRDRYRNVVEQIALGMKHDEQMVARQAVKMAKNAVDLNGGDRSTHVGYYLVDDGRARLESDLGYQPPLGKRIRRWVLANPTPVYIGSILTLTMAFVFLAVGYALNLGAAGWQVVLAGILAFIPALTISVDLVNSVMTHTLEPQVLPKMDYSEGIPNDCTSLVVIPTLLSSPEDIEPLLQQLQLHYLRNPDPNLYFALLTDFSDAPEEEMPEDQDLIQNAVQGIQALNDRYRRETPPPFMLLHRHRKWNPSEGVFMGWERKRGKLHELNRLIMEDKQTSYTECVGSIEMLPRVQFVITLDSDTILPGKSAHRLIATLAHPLNRAKFDPKTGEVIAGYTVLQPRTDINPTSANRTIFTRIFSGDTGLDLYTLAVSDVYQDFFKEGIYVGKGIYDVRAFERSLAGRIPENALLSHDLFEGITGRTALVTDIVLIEDYPSNYLIHAHRMHRWIRGDWQLFPWLFPKAPSGEIINRKVSETDRKPTYISNPLSLIDRWKIFDNLRRSLAAPALILFFIGGWTFLPGSPFYWTLAGLAAVSVPFLNSFLGGIGAYVRGPATKGARRPSLQPVKDTLARWFIALSLLPYEAIIASGAIITTLYRVYISRRSLLKWVSAARTAHLIGERVPIGAILRRMIRVIILVGLISIAILLTNTAAFLAALPLMLIWLLAFLILYWINQPIDFRPAPITQEQRRRLRSLARRTWLFFEQYMGPEDHWLPPDHYQESPRGITAHRTSPTNIGLGLLSVQAAYDLGYLGILDLASRLRSMFEGMDKLEKYRGHLLNWYDTRNLDPLQPQYVSTVDSGNLAAALISLGQSCQSMVNASVLRWETWDGLLDTLDLLLEPLSRITDPEALPARDKLRTFLLDIRRQVDSVRDDPAAWPVLAAETLSAETWEELDRRLLALVKATAHTLGSDSLRRLRIYARTIRTHVEGARREIEMLLPWLTWLHRLPDLFLRDDLNPDLEQAIQAVNDVFPASPALKDLTEVSKAGREQIAHIIELMDRVNGGGSQFQEAYSWCNSFDKSLETAGMSAKILHIGYQELDRRCQNKVNEMEFGFLFDRQRQVFHIGYNVNLGKLDNSFYDLLASEARTASLIAIAKGDVPQSHWLHLSRPLTQIDSTQALLSWSATMFEYLMPNIHFRSYEGTLLHQSARAAVDHQIAYAKQKRIPWGISESSYYRFDANQVYQYRAFGVPGLGYKRGLGEDLVVAPYASMLGLPLRPQETLKNLDAFQEMGMLGPYGLYESIDFTKGRLALGEDYRIVYSYMAHHQGMILMSLLNYLQQNILIERTHADPRIKSVELLLQEQIPHDAPLEQIHADDGNSVRSVKTKIVTEPWKVRARPPQPRVHYLSNGNYTVMITSSGAGYSAWGDLDLTRWRADATLSNYGTWIYIQDRDNGALWSAGHQPTAADPQSRDVYFNPHLVHFRRRDQDISTEMEVLVAPNDDLEIRRITLTNHTGFRRVLRVASYAEVILAYQTGDERHPAFNKLFIQSEYIPEARALVVRRRPRSQQEDPVFLAHSLCLQQGQFSSGAFDSSRLAFLGRGGTVRFPTAMTRDIGVNEEAWLSGSQDATLDPIMSLGQEFELGPHSSVEFAFLTTVSNSKETAVSLLERYQAWHLIERAFDQGRSHAEVEMRQLGLNSTLLETYQRLLSVLIYPHRVMRSEPERLSANSKGQPALWAYGISGDFPILLLKVHGQDDITLVHDLLLAHAYWRKRRLKIDLVIINEQGVDYGQELNNQIYRLISRMKSDAWLNSRGGIFLLLADRLSERDRDLIEASARVVLDGKKGALKEQIKEMESLPVRLPSFSPINPDEKARKPDEPVERPKDLSFDNGLGGFSETGHEYLIYLEPGRWTPAPWTNVIANPEFGFLVSESGSGFSWAINSGENRLTPWSNDPVSDPPGEVVYLRDEETGIVWTPTPLPARVDAPYLIRHGAGYSIFEHNSQGLKQNLRMFIDPNAPVKIIQLRLENTWDSGRRITATYFVEWVLGVNRSTSQQYIVPEFDTDSQALLARNPYNVEFGERVAFVAANKPLHGLTADREEFLGRMGSYSQPMGLARMGLSGNVAPGLDPCAAIQLHIDLSPGGVEEIYFIIGQGPTREEALELVQRFRNPRQVDKAWQDTQEFWNDLLGSVSVETPDPAMNMFLNRWLLYQGLACRIWGRSAFYQSSGAYGFRDQLQDVMALVHTAPELAREHIIRAAHNQFEMGDVLHWWHPPSGRGVRTRYSDDLLWLPYVTSHYITSTGDMALLEEKAPFLRGKLLDPGEKERYGHYESTEAAFTIYEHCLRAIDKGSAYGPHNLPLMGSGDWNDGMNNVGIEGKGESIWLGWFLHDTYIQFARICELRGDGAQANVLRERAEDLSRALDEHGWDGEWYLRAYYDDGSKLGSQDNNECKIDAIAQAWSILSDAGDPERSRQAMDSVSEHLVVPEDRLLLLFKPPFDKTSRDPGYIKGYLPGIRENGGQYTHAAIWAIWAFAKLGRGDYAEWLFRLINPIYHTDSPEKIERYRVEPYVIAADVYSVPPLNGHGGWTWYTGSSSWMYRLGLEAILGLRLEGGALIIDPCIPKQWPGYRATYRHEQAIYEIEVDNPDSVCRGIRQIEVDGNVIDADKLQLQKSGSYKVRVIMGSME